MDGDKLIMNLEDIPAMREAMQRAISEFKAKEPYTILPLNATNDSIFIVDNQYKLVTWNTPFSRASKLIGVQLKRGMNAFEWRPEKMEEYALLYKRVFAGETFEFTSQHELNGRIYHFLSILTPLKSEAREIFEVAVFSQKVIAVMTTVQIQTARLLAATKKQAELLRTNGEGFRKSSENLRRAMDELLWNLKNNSRIYDLGNLSWMNNNSF